MRIAVISDLHSNATAVSAALSLADAYGFDTLVILGDLLTYGCDPREVLDLVNETLSRHAARLVTGNHDQLYFDLATGKAAYFERLPAWLRETVQWTHERLSGIDLATDFPWEEHLSLGGIFFAHANPFIYGDWTYLTGDSELDAAMATLQHRGESIGVFGHTHRGKIVEYANRKTRRAHLELGIQSCFTRRISPSDGAVADPGSVGQPRGQGHFSSLLFIETSKAGVQLDLRRLSYDVDAHLARIRDSTLSDGTKTKLMGYFA